MQWTPRRSIGLIHVNHIYPIFFRKLCYPLQQVSVCPDVDVIEVAVVSRDILWIADLDCGDPDAIIVNDAK
jgi:hypothetical protein